MKRKKKHTKKKYLRSCIECGRKFFTPDEKALFIKEHIPFPTRCIKCEEEFQIKNIIQNPDSLAVKQTETQTIAADTNTLFIIGNGFDLAHGVPSGYYNFRRFLHSNSMVRLILENLINKHDIWANLENSLAYLDRGAILDNIDDTLKDFGAWDEDDEDFSYGKFHAAIETAVTPATVLPQKLPRVLKKWICSLQTPQRKENIAQLLCDKSMFINFNYTEFLETVYRINGEKILYIHGDRRKKEKLIIGHGHNTEQLFEEWHSENKAIKRLPDSPTQLGYFTNENNLTHYKSSMQYYAIDQAIPMIEEYFDETKKDTAGIINSNKVFFNKLQNITKVIVLGHSISKVDYNYFKKVIEINNAPQLLKWYISWYNLDDLARYAEFTQLFEINKEQITLFRM